jgi:hypothetical protein
MAKLLFYIAVGLSEQNLREIIRQEVGAAAVKLVGNIRYGSTNRSER